MPPVPTAGVRTRRTRKTTTSAQSTNGAGRLTDAQLDKLVKALEAARDGDFTVRLRAEGPLADVAAAFNELVERNQQVTKELVRVSKVVGREGRINERASVAGAPGSWAEKVGAVNELDRQPGAADDRGRARDRRRRRRRPDAADPARDRRPAGARRVPPHRHDRERDGRPALLASPPR